MRDLPSGTVTFLFTDIEGSTRLLDTLGEHSYAEALDEHRRVLREVFTRHGGVEVDTQGDAFFVAFPTVPGALAAGIEATEALATSPISVRIGLHTGSPLLTGEGYVGTDLHRAARISAAGHGGQVLVSATTASFVDRASLRDLGEHRFKDLAAPERVYQVGDEEFPPLRSLYRTNLPVPATLFLGRERELSEVIGMLVRESVRLLTLIGPGGTGKTRLALQAAAETAEEFPDGTWWVPLAQLRDPALVLPTVSQTLGLKERPGVSVGDTLSSELAGRRALLLLDNCEHLLPDVAGAIGLLRDIPGPMVVVTSRERLHIRGEQTWPVPPLTAADGVGLFVARARSLDPSFEPTPAVQELCTRLDELPLAIELAAARTSLFSPGQLLERLGQRLDLFKGERDADPRQLTLRATIEWSYDLLTEEERELFRRLSPFAGGCSYEAAELVSGADPDTLQSLLDKSLLRRRESDVGVRYSMLETVREFAADRLIASGDADELLRRHATWYAANVAGLSGAVRDDEPGARAALTADMANARLALAFALSHKDIRIAGDCIFGLWFYWLTQGLGREAATAADAWLALDRTVLTEIERVPGLSASAEIVRHTGDLRRGAELKYEELSVARSYPDEIVNGWEMRRAIPALLSDLAFIELALGTVAVARVLADEALLIRREMGAPEGIGHALMAAGTVALVEGDVQRARAACKEGVEAMGGTRDSWEAILLLAECEVLLGNLESAAHGLGTGVKLLRTIRDVTGIADAARVAGVLALERGDPETAALLTGAFLHALQEAGLTLSHNANWHRTYRSATERLRIALGAERLEGACSRGAQLAEGEVLDLVASAASRDGPDSAQHSRD